MINIRAAHHGDAGVITPLLRAMLEEMASMGGHPVAEDGSVWAQLEEHIRGEIGKPEHVYFLAESVEVHSEPIGFAEARVVKPAFVFVPRRILHVHSLYVRESYRRQGIGRKLFEAMITWGRNQGCVQAELSVLAANPAHSLYEQFGFRVAEFEMIAQL